MLKIENLTLSPDEPQSLLYDKAAAALRVGKNKLRDLLILRRSVDAREGVRFVYTVAVCTEGEAAILRRAKGRVRLTH